MSTQRIYDGKDIIICVAVIDRLGNNMNKLTIYYDAHFRKRK